MDTSKFIESYRKGFGNSELPIGFWYSSEPKVATTATKGCFIKFLEKARKGDVVSFCAETIACPGGKVYTGFIDPPPFIANFVSNKEKYKQTPEQVDNFIAELNLPKAQEKYINFASIEKVANINSLEGLIFFATPDILSGLVSWVQFDRNEADVVSVPFGSGCSTLISNTIIENRKDGYRSFLGMFDPSARPSVGANELTLSIPVSRFKEMYSTIDDCCLHGTRDWSRVKDRINNEL